MPCSLSCGLAFDSGRVVEAVFAGTIGQSSSLVVPSFWLLGKSDKECTSLSRITVRRYCLKFADIETRIRAKQDAAVAIDKEKLASSGQKASHRVLSRHGAWRPLTKQLRLHCSPQGFTIAPLLLGVSLPSLHVFGQLFCRRLIQRVLVRTICIQSCLLKALIVS